MEGRKSRDAIQFRQEYMAALVKRLDPVRLAQVLAGKVMKGENWAISELHDRLFGKPAQAAADAIPQNTTFRILWGDDRVDEETGLIIRSKGYVGSCDHMIDGRKPIEEERARVADLEARHKAGLPPSWERPALEAHRGAPGPSARTLEAFEEADRRRLLTAGQEAQAAADEGEDYIDACKKA